MGGAAPEPGRFALVARDLRAGHAESWHQGAAAVATPDGRVVAALGDPGLPAFLRSAAKPFQAFPLLMAGGWERWELSEADLALICASHCGGPEHVRRVAALLEKGGLAPEQLLCGSHPPLDEECARRLEAAGGAPTALHNNCSGKHAGMLLACRLLELPTEEYVAPGHPLQRRVLAELAAAAALDRSEIAIGVDGCSLPTYLLPLTAAARAYAALADPAAAGLQSPAASAAERVVRSMTGAPGMVAGPGRFTTRLMEVTGGRILGKEGASGYYAAAVRGPVALGMALKIVDGDQRCRDGVVLDVLRQLGVLSGAEFGRLESFHRPEIRNHRGAVVGEVVPDLELRESGIEVF